MAVSIHELFSRFNLQYSKPKKWNEKFSAEFNGVYLIAKTNDPFTKEVKFPELKISSCAFNNWLKEANDLKIDDKKIKNINDVYEHIKNFWNPNENILYIGQSSSKNNFIDKRVKQFYVHKIGQQGPHTGGYWLKLLECLKDSFVFYAPSDNPRDNEFKMLMKYVECSTGRSFYELENIGRYLPFANLTASFYKEHKIKNPTNKNKKIVSKYPNS